MPDDNKPQFDEAAFLAKLQLEITNATKPLQTKLTALEQTNTELTAKLKKAEDDKTAAEEAKKLADEEKAKGITDPNSPAAVELRAMKKKQGELEKQLQDAEKKTQEKEAKANNLTRESAVVSAVSNPDFKWASPTIRDMVSSNLKTMAKLSEDGAVVVGTENTPIGDYVKNLYNSDPTLQVSTGKGGSGNTDKEFKSESAKYDAIMTKPLHEVNEDDRKYLENHAKQIAAQHFPR